MSPESHDLEAFDPHLPDWLRRLKDGGSATESVKSAADVQMVQWRFGPARVCRVPLAALCRMIRVHAACLALSLAWGADTVSAQGRAAQDQKESDRKYSSRRMADGRQWTTENLAVRIDGSYCYDDAEGRCGRYGRLYTWEAARRACESLRDGWRLATDEEWRQLAKSYGGVSSDSADRGVAAYGRLVSGGISGFDALLGGGRSEDGQYARLEAHGFYWTASQSDPLKAWFYNFGKGQLALHRQREGEMGRAFSVRCVRD